MIEAKDRAMSGREMRDEMREAKTNRGAAVGLVVFTPSHAPTRHRPVRRPGRRRLLRRRPERAGSGARSRRPSGWPGCWPRSACATQAIEVDAAAIKTALDGRPRAARADQAA